jgi:Tol biopolymer transport system component
MRLIRLAPIAAAGALMVGATGCVPQGWENQLVVGPVDSSRPVLSPDGTTVAFVSNAALAPEDSNAANDVYLRDLDTGTTTLVSVNAAGTGSGNEQSFNPVFSSDGHKVAFGSAASDLTSTPVAPYSTNVFVRDLTTGTTSLVTVNAAGTEGIGGHTAAISPDGTKVLFETYASEFGPTDSNGLTDLYVRDLSAGTTSLVSADATGTDSGNNWSGTGSFAPDGSAVLFHSNANDLGPTDTNAGGEPGTGYGYRDVYLRDLATGTTSLVSVNAAGTDSGNGGSDGAALSPDGTEVAFHSGATDLVPGVDQAVANIYVHDLATGITELASPAASGGGGGDSHSREPYFSPDGTKLVFASDASDLGPSDTNGQRDVYVRDLAADETILVSVNAAGTNGGNGGSWTGANEVPTFSPDGTRVAFVTRASDLGPADTAMCDFDPRPIPPEPCPDVYVRDLTAATTALVSGSGGDSIPNTSSSWPVFSPVSDGQVLFLRGNSIYQATGAG